MYNSEKIYELLECRGIKHKDLIKALGLHEKTSLRQMCDRNISVDRLEKIADFFNVSIDTFFERNVTVNGVQVNGNGHNIKGIKVGADSDKGESLERLITEKDKRIKLLEDMVDMLRSQQPQK